MMWELMVFAALMAATGYWVYVEMKHNPNHVAEIEKELEAKVGWPQSPSPPPDVPKA